MSDELEQFRQTFFDECAELLVQAEEGLSDLVEGGHSKDTLNAIFRSVHSIKGGAGAFQLRQLVGFAHVFETLLDALRDARVPITPEVVEVLLRSNDALVALVDAAREGKNLAAEFGKDLIVQMESFLSGSTGAAATSKAEEPEAVEKDGERVFIVKFVPNRDIMKFANEPLLLLRELKTLGEVKINIDTEQVPELSVILAEDCYLSWTIELKTSRSVKDVREVFEFVEDDCKLEITDKSTKEEKSAAAPTLVAAASTTTAAPIPIKPVASAAEPAEAGEGGGPGKGKGAVTGSIRVDLDRVDKLVNMVGELVITQAMIAEQINRLPPEEHPALYSGLEQLAQHTRELQESVMAIRAQPVKSVFQRVPRLVRETATKLNKKVDLLMYGESTEVDKTVIEQLGDPLVHMVRNALDHGLETPEERIAAGKPEKGTVKLSADQHGGRIYIVLEDDGRGINREKVLSKAVERGLVPADARLTDEEIDQLIFLPGFSTADKVSDVSGRGVGMDVVRSNIQNMGGRVVVESTPGKGSRFVLTLPLTLAVMDGMVVKVGKETYVVPLSNIVESLRPKRSDVNRLVDRGEVMALRGDYIGLLHLSDVFNLDGAERDPCKAIVVLTESEGSKRVGVVVDEIIGQQQVVIKSLEANYTPVEGVSGATILGNGRVALILNIEDLQKMVEKGMRRANVSAAA